MILLQKSGLHQGRRFVMGFTTVVTGAWNMFATKIMAFLPMLLGALFLFIIGLIVAKVVRIGVVRLLKLIRFDSAGEKTGFSEFLKKGEIVKPPSEIIGTLVYWFMMILVIIATLDALGLPIVSDILNDIFLYIPNVVAAIIVLVLGFLSADLLSAVVRTAASNAGLEYAESLGKISFYAVVVFVVSIALFQLGIGKEIIGELFMLTFGAVALALGLAFGLGGKEVAGEYLKKWLSNKET